MILPRLQNLKIWLNPDNISVNHGDMINTWHPYGDTSISAIASTNPNAQPKLSIVNNIKFVEFSGNQRMDLSSNVFNINTPMTIFVVTKSKDSGHIIGTSTSSSPYLTYLKGLAIADNKFIVSARNNGNGAVVESNLTYENKLEVITVKFKSRATSLVTSEETKTDSANNLSFYNYPKSTIGASDGSNRNSVINPLTGLIGEILVYDAELTPAEIEQVTKYLNFKYIFNKKYLVFNNGVYKHYNKTTAQWENIVGEIDSDSFVNYGMYDIENLDMLNGKVEFLLWIDKQTDESLIVNNLEVLPLPQLVYPKTDISIIGVESIDSLHLIATGNVKIAISVDSGVDYYAYKNNTWTVIDNAHDGMTVSEFNNLSALQISELRGQNNTIRFSYSLEDNAEVDKIEMSATMQGTEQIANSSDYDLDYDSNNKIIIYNIKKSGTYSVNYLDA